jgi:hypothetical protein
MSLKNGQKKEKRVERCAGWHKSLPRKEAYMGFLFKDNRSGAMYLP